MRMKLPTACLLLISLAATLPAHAVFKCVDEKGVTHYGDTMPPQCAKKEVTEISKSGGLIRKYDAPLTPEQLKVRNEQRAREAEQQRRIDGQRQKDLALLSTYGAEREFDLSRDRDLLQLDGRIKTLKQRIAEIDLQLGKLKAEMEFYSGDGSKGTKAGKVNEPPPRLTTAIARAKSDRSGLDEEIARVEKDKTAVAARYETDKSRWKQMKAGMSPGTLADAATTPAPNSAADKHPATR
jgi:chromosome segregation ATPase